LVQKATAAKHDHFYMAVSLTVFLIAFSSNLVKVRNSLNEKQNMKPESVNLSWDKHGCLLVT